MRMVIGIAGFAGSGKGTVADVLVQEYGFHKISFADAVKDAVSAVFGWQRQLLEGDTDESREFRECRDSWWSEKLGYNMTPRLAMQLMGTEAGRDVFHKDIWLHAVNNKLRMTPHEHIVIPDVRFKNEIDFVREAGGMNIRVRRGADPHWYETALYANLKNNTDLMTPYNVHYSEWAWIGSQFDYQVDNEGTFDQLKAEISHLMKVFTGPVNSDTIRTASA
jgi:hypothetical protein